jgi:hypothetical protein
MQLNAEDTGMNKALSVEHAVEAFAGFMVLVSVVLTYFVHPAWMWLTVFVGFNLFQQSFTGFCPAAFIMKKLFGLKTEAELAA